MTTKDLKKTLQSLQAEAHKLAIAELDEMGDPTERYQTARQLNEELMTLRGRVESSDQPELSDLWRAAERDLIFLLAAANQAGATQKPDINELARQLSEEAFELAKEVARGRGDLDAIRQTVIVLDNRLKEIARMPGRDTPNIQRALSDADLDLTYAYDGGKGATSLRLQRYLQAQNES